MEAVVQQQLATLPPPVIASAQARSTITRDLIQWIKTFGWNPDKPQDINAWFATHAEAIAEMITQAQLQAALLAGVAVDDALDWQGYTGPTDITVNPVQFAGVAGDGRPNLGLVYAQSLKVAEAQDEELPPTALYQVWQSAGKQLLVVAHTAVSDASRAAKSVQMMARPGTGWIRMVRPPCCARCAILAGKKAQSPRVGFARHPGCDCDAVTVKDYKNRAHDRDLDGWIFDTQEYFDALTPEQQNRIFTIAGAKAIRDGADPAQVVNARRSMHTITDKFGVKTSVTHEGTTKRGWAADYLRQQYNAKFVKHHGEHYRRTNRSRLMPEEIYKIAGDDHDKALTLLHRNGYLIDASPGLDGTKSYFPHDAEVARAAERVRARLQARRRNSRNSSGNSRRGRQHARRDRTPSFSSGGGFPPTLPPVRIRVGMGDDDDEAKRLKEEFEEVRAAGYDATLPVDHVVNGRISPGENVSGAHSFEVRDRVHREVSRGRARVPDSGKTFFPQFPGRTVEERNNNLVRWLEEMLSETIADPARVRYGFEGTRRLHKIVQTPDGQDIEICVYIQYIIERGIRKFKVNTIFPVRGGGTTKITPNGEIRRVD
ncbi:MAG: hypothetical protein Q4A82_01040 [Corynebacterium sp.]|nr:hypothetical protein [Corynebacterium sp.]